MHAYLDSFMEIVGSEIPSPDIPPNPQRTVRLPLAGQGTVAFEVGNPKGTLTRYTIALSGPTMPSPHWVVIEDKRVAFHWLLPNGERREASAPVTSPLLTFPQSSQFIWVSIDKVNERVRIGRGYMMERNTLLSVNVAEPRAPGQPRPRGVLADVETVVLDGFVPLVSTKVNRLPVVQDPPPVVLPVDALTLDHISDNTAIPTPVLPPEAQRLYGTVAGRSIELGDNDVAAIEHSLKTPGLTLFKKVEEKRAAARQQDPNADPNRVYLRVTIGPNEGNSPGSPFVLEIWPPHCYSPVHDHSNTVAIIKVLSGEIHVDWYNPLAASGHVGDPEPIGNGSLRTGEVTWISPEMYQTHKLKNPSPTVTCITLQSYKYLDSDVRHYETFDFVTPGKRDKQHFEPTSDFELAVMLRIVREEYRQATSLAAG